MGPGRQRQRRGAEGVAAAVARDAGPTRLLGRAGRCGAQGEKPSWASGSGSWAARLLGPKTEKGEEKNNKTPFLFPKTYFQNQFQFKFQFSLKFFINTKHSQNNMQ